ncbi:MAG: hypothetical protein WC242_03190 [Candidatus Paceibacterota bacterium]|jgi:hypothetical protein
MSDLQLAMMEENRRNLKVTVLHRPGGKWTNIEVGRLINGLMTEAVQCRDHPEYVVLYGHYTKEQTLEALGGVMAYTAIQVTGADDPRIPFPTGFCL